jgi:prepilin-type N-terminal cleavage/methylation domain-containing protein
MKKNFGFTLIEIVIVISIIAVIIPTIFAIIYSIMREQVKIFTLTQVKREGDNALNIMTTLIRNSAVTVHSGPPTDNNVVCTKSTETWPLNSTDPLYFQDRYGDWFSFIAVSDAQNQERYKISSDSSGLNDVDLTSFSNTNVQDFKISCQGTAENSPPLISISYVINQLSQTNREEDIASLNYQTKVKLRMH